MSSYERTGWRDTERLSERHRMYGVNVPCCDLDFPLVEYDKGKAVALIEYKHQKAQTVNMNNPSIRALSDLATRSEIPAFVVRYSDNFSTYRITAINTIAEDMIKRSTIDCTEREYIKFLYWLRGYKVPEDVLTNIDKKI